jgi:hypothetical protein
MTLIALILISEIKHLEKGIEIQKSSAAFWRDRAYAKADEIEQLESEIDNMEETYTEILDLLGYELTDDGDLVKIKKTKKTTKK